MKLPPLFSVAVALLAAAGAAEPPKPAGALDKSRPVLSVVKVEVRILESHPAQWQIEARGTANSGGWTNPRLVQRGQPADGVLRFDFLATPPSGVATMNVPPISARTTITAIPGVREIEVVAQTNRQRSAVAP